MSTRCHRCGAERLTAARHGTAWCRLCLSAANTVARARYAAMRRRGRCGLCKEPAAPGRARCPVCLRRNAAAARVARAKGGAE